MKPILKFFRIFLLSLFYVFFSLGIGIYLSNHAPYLDELTGYSVKMIHYSNSDFGEIYFKVKETKPDIGIGGKVNHQKMYVLKDKATRWSKFSVHILEKNGAFSYFYINDFNLETLNSKSELQNYLLNDCSPKGNFDRQTLCMLWLYHQLLNK